MGKATPFATVGAGSNLSVSGAPQGMRTLTVEQRRALVESYMLNRALNIKLAKADPATFAKMVLRDERTNGRIELAPVHEKWHKLVSANRNVVIWSHIEGGKTSQLSVARPIWDLGNDHNLRVAIISKTASAAEKILRSAARYITHSADVKEIFPTLRPASGLPWNNSMITVERTALSKDPSIQATGVLRGSIQGSRLDRAYLDDILDYENTRSEQSRLEMVQWLNAAIFSRMDESGRICFVGNAWHPKDAMHQLVSGKAFQGYRFPVVDDEGKLTWPSRWNEARIERAREMFSPLEFGRQLLCKAYNDEDARFKAEWLEGCKANGRGFRIVNEVPTLEPGYAIFHGVDLATGKSRVKGDLTSIFTILLHPDGTRHVLFIQSGRWTGPEIVKKLDETDKAFGGIFIIENVAAQHYILQFAERLTSATCRPFTTGTNKADPRFGVESLAAEMAGGRWLIPNGAHGVMHPEVAAWVDEMLFYDPRSHTGDRLMASWFAREGARYYERTLREDGDIFDRGGGVRVFGGDPQMGTDHDVIEEVALEHVEAGLDDTAPVLADEHEDEGDFELARMFRGNAAAAE